jgi:hypothetical protein
MTIDLLAQFLAVASCAVIVWRAESVINRMSRCTPFLVRLAFWLILVAASSAVALIVLRGDVPPWPSVFGSIGTACLLFCERRLRYLSKRPKERAQA